MRLRSVADGKQVDIPVPHGNRTVGTQKESQSRERKDRCKRYPEGRQIPLSKEKDVTGSERKVTKLVSWLPRKAAIDPYVPVP